MRLLSLLISLAILVGGLGMARAATEADAVRQALSAMRSGQWQVAASEAQPAGSAAVDVIEWHRLRKGGIAGFEDYIAFLERRSDWPGLPLLRTRGEQSIPDDADPAVVLAYFGGDLPQTGNGVLGVVRAHRALGNDGDALATAVLAWRSLSMTQEAEDILLEYYGSALAEHHEARLDEMLWQGETAAVDRMLPRVSEGWRNLAAARLALAVRAPGVDTLIARVPASLRETAGLAYERFNWRARNGRNAEAIALLAERSRSPDLLGHPEKWANWRRIYARQLARNGQYEEAYSIASLHFLVEGNNFADLEWLAGYIALRFLNDPELALLHFERFETSVASPISLGRAGYWKGRAYTALGDAEAAAAAYAQGAEHQSSFYGLLAAEAAGLPMDPTLAGDEVFPPLAETDLAGSSVLEAGYLLLDAGELNLAERFLTHLVEGKPRSASGSLAAEMLARGEPHVALMIAKRTAQETVVLPAAYFPLSPLMDGDLPVAKELALAIARRESEFDPVVVSPAGARGLMQLMPGTASDVSDELGIDYSRDRLTRDPAYNVRLGSTYLAGLTEIFGPAPVLVAVGYNAGPGRSIDWVKRYGDPRQRSVDVIDWIEGIPFRETRNYVMRVTESVLVYRARLNGVTADPISVTDYLYGG